MANAAKEFTVALSKASIDRLAGKNGDAPGAGPALSAPAGPTFSIRYSVPPDSLNCDVNDLNLRRTPRGEYLVEEKDDAGSPTKGPAPSRLGKPTFRGPGNPSRDTECVLIYNPDVGQYELHFLDLEIPVAPALKTRARSGTPVEPAGSQPTPSIFHARKPAAKTGPGSSHGSQGAAAAPPASKPPTPATGTTPAASSRPTSPLAGASSTPGPTPSAGAPGVSPMHASTQLAPAAAGSRPKKTKNLPTRRKLVSKVKQVGRELAEARAHDDEDAGPSVLAAMNLPTVSGSGTGRPSSGTTTAAPPAGPPPAAPSIDAPGPDRAPSPDRAASPPAASPSAADKFDEDFNDFADELADDLMEASDEEEAPAPSKPKSMGTAGGSAEDGDSSEEE